MATRIPEDYTTSLDSLDSLVSWVSFYDLPVPLHRPLPIPHRFRRPVQDSVRQLIERRHQRRRAALRQRWMRSWSRFEGRIRALRWLAVPLLAVAGILIIALLCSLFLFSPWTKIQEIRVIRQDPRVDIATVQHALSPLFGRRMLLLSRADVLPLLEGTLPDLQEVTVDLVYPSRLVVRLTLDALIAQLQIDDTALASQSGALLHDFLTEEGIYVQYLPSQVRSRETLPIIHITDWGVRPLVGARLLPMNFLTKTRESEDTLRRDFGQEVTERLIFLRAREFHLRTAEWWLWFDTRTPLEDLFHRYRLFLQSVPRENVRKYVDLRITDRVVYQ